MKTSLKYFGNKITLGKIAIVIAIFVSCTILIHFMSHSTTTSQIVIEIVSPPHEDVYQLFYNTGKGFNEQESVSYTVKSSHDIVRAIFDLDVSLNQVKSIRIDPGSQANFLTKTRIKSIELVSVGKKYHWNATEILKNFKPVMDINYFSEKEGLLHINSIGRDPVFVSNFDFSIFSKNFTDLTIVELLLSLMVTVVSLIILLSGKRWNLTGLIGSISSCFTSKVTFKLFFPALILSVLILIPFALQRIQQFHSFFFEIALQSSVNAQAQLFYDIGNSFREQNSVAVPMNKSDTLVTYRFELPTGDYYHLRFDPVNMEAILTLSVAKIVDGAGNTIKVFPIESFKPAQQIDSLKKLSGELMQVVTSVRANDPILDIMLDQSFSLKGPTWNLDDWGTFISKQSGLFLLIFVACWGLLWLVGTFYTRYQQLLAIRGHQLANWIGEHPHSAILGMALFTMLLSSYPLVFFGKSLVSPNNGILLLYNSIPTLPGYENTETEYGNGSDVGALMWQHRSYSVVQHQAIFNDGEIPLWNRYGYTGTTLLGQGQSMLGDPLHLLTTVVSGGNALAWDIKFLIAKLLLVYGLGLIVYLVTRHLPAALIITGSAAFIGFFSLRFNHPAFFSLCYAPWILYCWLKITNVPSLKNSVLWMLGLLLASWVEMNSGTAKETYMLLIFLNLSGLITFLWSHDNNQLKLRKFFHLLGACILFVLISAPVWLTFLEAMKSAYTAYNVPVVWQANLFSVIGHFDEIFYRQLNDNEGLLYLPSVNFLILLGFLWSLSRLKHLLSNRTYVALGLSALISLVLVFAIVPASLIVKVPFLNNVWHIHNTFSCVLLIHLIVLAGFGIKECWEQVANRTWFSDWIVTLLLFSALLMLYFSYTNLSVPAVPRSQFFVVYSLLLVSAFITLPFMARQVILSKKVFSTPMFVVIICLLTLHGRHGLHLNTGYEQEFDKYVVNPQVRADLQAESPALQFVKSDAIQPYRTVGFYRNLFNGYNVAVGIESLYGCDALFNPFYRELLNTAQIIGEWEYVIEENTLTKFKPIYDLLNIKYYLGRSSFALPQLTIDKQLDLTVYHSDSVWPRAFFTDHLASYQTVGEFVNLVKQGDGRPFAAVQQANQPIQLPSATRKILPALDYHLTNNTTSFRVIAPSAGVIVLTEAFLADDFQVTLDGKPVDYFRVNHAFKGIKIDQAGTYTVRFSYWPKHFTLSLWLSLIGLIGLLGELLWAWWGNSTKTYKILKTS